MCINLCGMLLLFDCQIQQAAGSEKNCHNIVGSDDIAARIYEFYIINFR